MICQTALNSQNYKTFAEEGNLTAVFETMGEIRKKPCADMGNVQECLCTNKLSPTICKTEFWVTT